MTSSTALVTTNQNHVEDDFMDIFSDLDPIDPFKVKKDYLGAQLAALVSFCGESRSVLAQNLGWKRSRISSVLSGKNNLTIRTIWDISYHLGFDFDIVFHSPNEQRPYQPWQVRRAGTVSTLTINMLAPDEISQIPIQPVIVIQTAKEVARDFLMGNHNNYYFSVSIPKVVEPARMTLENPPQWNFAPIPMTTTHAR